MGTFVAATAVEPLGYDFTAFGGPQGTIPEPSSGQVDAYMAAIRDMAKEVAALKAKVESAEAEAKASGEEMTSEQIDEILGSMDDITIEKYQGQMADAIHNLTSGTPSADEIKALPHRVKQAFMQWITSEFRAEAGAPGTN